jgi:general secretion pathway protein D
LSRIPVIGGLFGQQKLTDNRTELVVFITPRLVENELDMKDLMNDLRRRMERLDNLFPASVGPDGTRAPVMTPWSLGDPVPLHPPTILVPPPEPAPVNVTR